MGSGTFVDGVRRWFQRRSSPSPSPSQPQPLVLNNKTSTTNVLTITDFQAKSSTAQDLTIVEDFDISGLNLIRVPKRIDFPSSSMDPNKKVSSFLLIIGPHLDLSHTVFQFLRGQLT